MMKCRPLAARLTAGALSLALASSLAPGDNLRAREVAAGDSPASSTIAATPQLTKEARGPATPIPALIAPLASRSLLLAAALAGNRLVAVGERGHILLSDDNGHSWRQAPAPANATLTGVRFIDARQGWAVGHDATILHTADGGESWTLQNFAPDWEQPLMDVLFDDADHGIAVGAYGLFLETADGGKTWTKRRITDDDLHLNAIFATGGDTRMVVGEAGGVYTSADKGHTWTKRVLPYEGSLFSGVAVDDRTVVVFGLQGHAFRSTDGGQNWQTIDTGTKAGLMGGVATPDGHVVLVGALGTVLSSSDGGASFKLTYRPDRLGLADAVRDADGGLILLGDEGPKLVGALP
ncbi:WD40/YVTN/BNR-like repeat-containing protein [Nitrospirillum sp. BR 11163]|uniref:WD40/YVTN/BNR-like repeat-containing protein n=1 Tax=Nitrospirillum sp. BR 11163 TaxID=3104323 RepID=UPI002AFE9FF5|nr:YCF48-related protein [Nitrospirillum sp. BR 11163]MEA1676906.1 YCF48-related protein [Nitrospirillum sp. BR 11163]